MNAAAERIGIWILTNLGQPDEPDPDQVDRIIDRLGNSSIPEVLGDLAYDLRDT